MASESTSKKNLSVLAQTLSCLQQISYTFEINLQMMWIGGSLQSALALKISFASSLFQAYFKPISFTVKFKHKFVSYMWP